MDAITIPMLPAADIDISLAFYEAIGFTRTYRQQRPNPYAVVERGAIGIHLFGIEGFDPADTASASSTRAELLVRSGDAAGAAVALATADAVTLAPADTATVAEERAHVASLLDDLMPVGAKPGERS